MGTAVIEIPVIEDYRGNIAVIENNIFPFEIKRVYYLFDIPSNAARGGHAHKCQTELIIPLSGSFDVVVDNGKIKQKFTMNKPNLGLLVTTNTWRELENFSSGAVCLVLSSGLFDEEDYIRDYDEFIKYI